MNLKAAPLLALLTLTARAQTNGDFDLSWSTLAGGGTGTNALWAVSGTAGQPGAAKSTNANWAVQGGFWNRVTANLSPVARPATFSRAKNTAIKIPISILMTNAFDPDAETPLFSGPSATSTNGGSVSANSTYVFFAPPASNGNVTDRFTYRVRDGFQGLGVGTVVITVTNAVGSPVGSLTVTNNSVVVKFAGIPGYSYELQRSTNLTEWVTRLTTNVPGAGLIQFMDDFGDLGSPPAQAYYRLRSD